MVEIAKRILAVTLVAAALLPALAVQAGLVGDIGADFAEGALEKIQPVLAGTLSDVETRATRLEDHIGSVASGVVAELDRAGAERLDQVDQILDARILQVNVVANQAVDHALHGVDDLVKNSLAEAEKTAARLVTDISEKARQTLDNANRMLAARIADVGHEVDGALQKADSILAARIEQADEAVERRLGNVDVIASKQRLALEETAIHVAVLIGLVAFVIYVLRRLYARYLELGASDRGRHDDDADRRLPALAGITVETIAAAPRPRATGMARTWFYARGLGVPLLGQLVLAAAGAGVVFLLYDTLPLAAQREARDLAQTHRTALARSLELLDFGHARFHASQLEFLDPAAAAGYRATVAKAELVRDVIERPTLLATDAGVRSVRSRVEEAQRLLARGPDPDLLVIEAMLVWHSGNSRSDESRAAGLCARALRLGGARGGFALAPLARATVEVFLDAPFPGADVGVGDLQRSLGEAGPSSPSRPLALELVELMRTVNVKTSDAYVAMAQAHAELVRRLDRRAAAGEVAEARAARTAAARLILDAWTDFDQALRARPALATDPAVLAIFRLNDTTYSRAKWFIERPETSSEAPLLVGPASQGDRKAARVLRMKLAPPRLVWARRYRKLMEGPARGVLGLQEAERFAARERMAQLFEVALVASESSSEKRLAAAMAAARLGVYVTGDHGRVPFARVLLPTSDEPELVRVLALRGPRML